MYVCYEREWVRSLYKHEYKFNANRSQDSHFLSMFSRIAEPRDQISSYGDMSNNFIDFMARMPVIFSTPCLVHFWKYGFPCDEPPAYPSEKWYDIPVNNPMITIGVY